MPDKQILVRPILDGRWQAECNGYHATAGSKAEAVAELKKRLTEMGMECPDIVYDPSGAIGAWMN